MTWFIIGACFLVFLWQSSLGAKAGEITLYQYGMIPARLFGMAKLRSHLVPIPRLSNSADIHVPTWWMAAFRTEHAVPVGLRLQGRGVHGPLSVLDLLPPLRGRRGRVRGRILVAEPPGECAPR